MADQRRMRRVGNSWVIPVSQTVRRHLKVTHAGDLYWHLAGPREAVLTPHPQRVGGKPSGIGLAKELDGARAEIERLRAKLAARPMRAFNEGASMGAAAVMRQTIPVEGALGAINARLDRIEEALARMPWARHSRRQRAPSRKVETVSAPVLDAPVLEETPA
jgi:hypothetical protein